MQKKNEVHKEWEWFSINISKITIFENEISIYLLRYTVCTIKLKKIKISKIFSESETENRLYNSINQKSMYI